MISLLWETESECHVTLKFHRGFIMTEPTNQSYPAHVSRSHVMIRGEKVHDITHDTVGREFDFSNRLNMVTSELKNTNLSPGRDF